MKGLLVICLALISALGVTLEASRADAGEVEKGVACGGGSRNQGRSKNGATAVNGRETGKDSFANGRGGSQYGRGFNEDNAEGRSGENGTMTPPSCVRPRWEEELRLLDVAIETLDRLARWEMGSWRPLNNEELNQDSRGASIDVLAPLRKEILWLEKVRDGIFDLSNLLKERKEYISQGRLLAPPK